MSRGRKKTCLPKAESFVSAQLRHMTPQTVALGTKRKPTTGPVVVVKCVIYLEFLIKATSYYKKAIQVKDTEMAFTDSINKND